MNNSKLSRIVLATILTAGAVFLSHNVRADENQDLKNQVKVLQEKVAQLEKQMANQNVQTSPRMAHPAAVRAYDVWDPFAEMRMVQQQMDQMMKDAAVDFNPKEDMKQTPEAYIISMDIPGMEKDKINVEIKEGVLIVSGMRDSEIKEKGPHNFYRQERSFGNFMRAIPLPDDVKTDNIEAQYNNGVLTIKVPRTKKGAITAGQKIKVK